MKSENISNTINKCQYPQLYITPTGLVYVTWWEVISEGNNNIVYWDNITRNKLSLYEGNFKFVITPKIVSVDNSIVYIPYLQKNQKWSVMCYSNLDDRVIIIDNSKNIPAHAITVLNNNVYFAVRIDGQLSIYDITELSIKKIMEIGGIALNTNIDMVSPNDILTIYCEEKNMEGTYNIYVDIEVIANISYLPMFMKIKYDYIDNKIWACWKGKQSNYYTITICKQDKNGWKEPVILQETNIGDGPIDFDVYNNKIWLIWKSLTDKQIYLGKFNKSGLLKKKWNLSNNGNSYDPSIKIDYNGNKHIVYTNDNEGNLNVYYIKKY